jgi:sulfur carrier protein
MQILVNGKAHAAADGATVAALLAELDLAGKRLAVEVNEDVIPRSRHPTHALAEGDRVEIVHAIGGG